MFQPEDQQEVQGRNIIRSIPSFPSTIAPGSGTVASNITCDGSSLPNHQRTETDRASSVWQKGKLIMQITIEIDIPGL
jgi:hypothetical protein